MKQGENYFLFGIPASPEETKRINDLYRQAKEPRPKKQFKFFIGLFQDGKLLELFGMPFVLTDSRQFNACLLLYNTMAGHMDDIYQKQVKRENDGTYIAFEYLTEY